MMPAASSTAACYLPTSGRFASDGCERSLVHSRREKGTPATAARVRSCGWPRGRGGQRTEPARTGTESMEETAFGREASPVTPAGDLRLERQILDLLSRIHSATVIDGVVSS